MNEDEFTQKMQSEIWVPPEVDRSHRIYTAIEVIERIGYSMKKVAKMYNVTVEEIQARLLKKEKPPEVVKKITFVELLQKMDTEVVYMRYDFEDCLVKFLPNGTRYVKFKGENEFIATRGSKVVADCELGMDVITEKEYNEYKERENTKTEIY